MTTLRFSERLLKKSNAKKANYDLIKNNKTKRLQNKLELLRKAGITFKKYNEERKCLQDKLELLRRHEHQLPLQLPETNFTKKSKFFREKLQMLIIPQNNI